jgi:hypothetical protein
MISNTIIISFIHAKDNYFSGKFLIINGFDHLKLF